MIWVVGEEGTEETGRPLSSCSQQVTDTEEEGKKEEVGKLSFEPEKEYLYQLMNYRLSELNVLTSSTRKTPAITVITTIYGCYLVFCVVALYKNCCDDRQ